MISNLANPEMNEAIVDCGSSKEGDIELIYRT